MHYPHRTSRIKRKRAIGFRARMKTRGGRKLINRQRRVPVARQPLENFLGRVRSALGLDGREVTVCLLSDSSMARLNRTYRGKAGPTDVLSFPANGGAARRRASTA